MMHSIVTVVGAIAIASAFPTVENLARLVERNGLPSLTAETAVEELNGQLARLKGKRLLFDPLTNPIDGTRTSDTSSDLVAVWEHQH